ncbi:MAG: hypothetical protein IPN72_20360 [Saprospiraceae bacterium]|nr:hypothetical protein [Saprospiraceae bacterium]
MIDAYNVTVYNPFPPTISEMEDLNYDCKDLVPIDNSGEVIAQAYCNTGSVNIYKSGSDNFLYNICENNFSFIRTFIATDDCNLSSTVQQTITVNDDESPIAATPPPNQIIYGCGDDYLVNGLIPDVNGYSDNCGDVTVTKSKLLRGGLGCSSDPMIIENIWEFTDACGNTSSVSQELRFIDNVAPDFSIPGNITVSCVDNMPNEIIPSYTDNCAIIGTSFDENDLGGIGNAASPKIFERIYSATDGCNVTTKSQFISVIDANPPRITSNWPSDISQKCQTLPPVPTVTAFDSESCAQITTTFRELTNGRTGCQGDILVVNRIWTFVDYVGNETVVTQTITINDSEGPELIFNITPEQDVQVNSPDLIPRADIIRANAIDNCNGNLSVTLTQTDNDKIGCASDPRYIYRTWTATDICGNLGIHDQLVTLIDDLPPTFTVPQDQDLDYDLGIPQQFTQSFKMLLIVQVWLVILIMISIFLEMVLMHKIH